MRISSKPARSAATIVESALIISILVLILFGIFEYGRFVMTRQLMENAAREGARWAVVHTYDGSTTDVQNAVDAKLSIARNQLVGYKKNQNIKVFAANAAGNVISGKEWNDVGFGEGVGVEISGTYRPTLPNLLFINASFTIRAKSVMASEAN